MENTQTPQVNPLVQKYAAARSNLITMLVLTVLNIVLLVADANYMLLFSATVPYAATVMAMEFGLFPGLEGYMYTAIAVAVVCLALYLVCWLLSKKNVIWMIVAFALFILDTAYMAYIYISAGEASGFLDILIHALILYYLFVGVISGIKLKKQLEEDVSAEATVTETDSADTDTVDTEQ
ncbi:MAG: hypothetical protein IJD97_00125 [Clostridia bacterium]|nr:hypothetical protein [Clostridia bacterium]